MLYFRLRIVEPAVISDWFMFIIVFTFYEISCQLPKQMSSLCLKSVYRKFICIIFIVTYLFCCCKEIMKLTNRSGVDRKQTANHLFRSAIGSELNWNQNVIETHWHERFCRWDSGVFWPDRTGSLVLIAYRL